MSYQPVYRDGKVHVHRTMCSTCIFRPGNLMYLEEGRVEGMVADAGDDGCIPCHEVLGDEPSVCRGFYDRHQNSLLQIAERLDMVEFTEPPKEGYARRDHPTPGRLTPDHQLPDDGDDATSEAQPAATGLRTARA